MWKRYFQLMDAATGGDGTGGTGASGAPGDAGAGDAGAGAGAGAAGDASGAPGGSFLSQGQDPGSNQDVDATALALEKANAELTYIPEKYRVKKEDGTYDLEASAKKQSEGLSQLEKKLGTDGARPNAETDYTFTVPDALKDHFKPEEDQGYLDFRKEAHAMGLTQKQFESVVSRHLESVGQIGGAQTIDPAQTESKLRAIWPTEGDYKKNLNAGYRAMAAYANAGGDDKVGSFMNLDRKFGDDPDFIAFMANIGREIREDIPPIGALMSNESIDALTKSAAYMNPEDPKHAEVTAKVRAHFDRKFPNKV